MRISLIIIGMIALLFTSCERDEMGAGGTSTSGGGMSNSCATSATPIPVSLEKEVPASSNAEVNDSESLFYNSNKLSAIE